VTRGVILLFESRSKDERAHFPRSLCGGDLARS
jgi:hypothetical protein